MCISVASAWAVLGSSQGRKNRGSTCFEGVDPEPQDPRREIRTVQVLTERTASLAQPRKAMSSTAQSLTLRLSSRTKL